MKGLFTTAAFLAALAVMPIKAQTVDQLYDQVRSGNFEKSEAAIEMEKRFASAGAGKQAIVEQLRAQRAQLEAQANSTEDQFAVNDEALNALRNNREKALGDLKELFGAVQQVLGEAEAGFSTSVISAQFPTRTDSFDEISAKVSNQSNELVTAAEIESVWQAVFAEMVEQGKVARFSTPVATASGGKEEQSVVRVGSFNLIGDGTYLSYGAGSVAELPRQPSGAASGQAASLYGASAGEVVEFSIDPTKGTLLGSLVESPSLMERVNQGGTVGYIILSVGFIAALIAFYKIFTLFGVASAVQKQAKNPDSPSSNNPLGRVLKAVTDNPKSDTEAMELRLSEAIMKETPKLTSWLMFIKIVSVVAPLAGLLGTVLGMIETFQSITLFGAGDPKLMAGGISTALVTTVCGLVVAIPIVLLHTAAASKAKRVEEILEEQAAGMVARKLEK